jgi:RHS repeat-associated protein
MTTYYWIKKTRVLLLALTLLNVSLAKAQPPPPVACSISGSSSVSLLSTETYTLSSGCTCTSWTVTCGTVQSYTTTSVTIYFNECSCSSSTITANGSSASPKSVTVTWTALTGGTISAPTHQYIYTGTAPAQIDASVPTQGNCSGYTYQWDNSTNGTTYSSISGATSQNYQPGTLTTTTYYKREAFDYTQSAYTTNIDTVTVCSALTSGTITPSSITVNFDKAPTSGFSVSGTSGGNPPYTYAWQSSTASSGPYSRIAGATSSSYTPPGAQTASSWYEVVQYSLGDSVTSAPAELIVNPEVFPGTISPSYLVISSGTSPGMLTGSAATGGGCSGSYAYQWQSSTNDVSWTNISGEDSLDYTPGTLTSSMWYRRQVICGTDTEYSNTAQIVVGTPNTSYNFIRVRNIQKAGVMDTVTADGLTSPYDVAQTTQYYDGLGRLVQTVAKEASPLENDMVKPVVYDNFGRQATDYLPYTATTNDGNFKPTALQDQETFNSTQFPGEEVYYGQVSYEASPLNRPLVTYAAGASWVGSGHGQSAEYLVNTAADSVQLWTISSVQLSLPVDNGAYLAGQLFKNVAIDEQGNQVVSYTDKLGRTLMKKQQVLASPSSGHYGWLCTYYVYDTLQNLRVIIQPQAVALMNGSWTMNQTIANELCFRYEYDGRRNQAIRKVPGAGQLWRVYDTRNRVAMTQDSAMRYNHQWLFVKYDSENRPDSTGTITDPSHYDSLAYHDSLAYYSTGYPTVGSYTNQLLTQSFYDDYSWVSTYSAPVGSSMATTDTGNSSYFITTYNSSPTYAVPVTPFAVNRGMKTGSRQLVIGTTSTYLFYSTFYDDRARVIQTENVNYTGAIDTATVQYNFCGVPLRRLINHKKNNNTVQNHIVLTLMDYDQSMRLRHVYKNIDNAASNQLIDSLQYNELGQLSAKYLGNQVDSLIYTYNIRGWLTGINKNYVAGTANHYFGMEIGYNSTSSVAPGNTYLNPELNGNIEGLVWKGAASGINRKYDFSYDPANRLTAAAFLQNTSGTSWDKNQIDFSVSGISYDANGNMRTMTQRGFTVGGSAPIDSLFYNYINPDSSNRLIEVSDSANNPTSLLEDFHYNTSTKQSTDYAYDGNGNLIKDNNKAIDTMTYNYLNLPQHLHIKGEGDITYTYDAAGNKLAKVIADSVAGLATTITYAASFVYQQRAPLSSPGSATDTLQFIGHEEGRARWAYQKYTTGTTAYKFEYDFFERDHLGNTRTVLTQERDTTNYIATMEAAYRSTESQLFGNIVATDTSWTSMPNYASISNTLRYQYTSPNDSVSKVDSSSAGGQKVGPNLLLKVMSGDTVNFSVQCYYVSPGGGSTNYSSFSDVLNSLSNGLANLTGGAHGTFSNFTQNGSSVYNGLTSFLGRDSVHSGYPKAYINWIFLDDQFNYDSALSGAVPAAGSNSPAGQMNPVAPGGPIALNKSGYLYIWVSNETTGWDVYYDNLTVQYKQGPLLEENHYYPFGLTMAGLSDKAIKTNYSENKYRYNSGTELQNKEFSDGTGLEYYDAGFRRLDPQLGRFTQNDPLSAATDYQSGYQFGGDNPVSLNDPTGQKQEYPGPQNLLRGIIAKEGTGDDINDALDQLFESQVYLDGVIASSASFSVASYWSNLISQLLQQIVPANMAYFPTNGIIGSPQGPLGQNEADDNSNEMGSQTDNPDMIENFGNPVSSQKPLQSFYVFSGSGLLGIIDVLEFGENPERGPGVDVVFGFTNLSDIPTSQFNWVQQAVGDEAPYGMFENLLFSDCLSNYCPFYYGPNGQNILHSSDYFNPIEMSYDLLFQDQPYMAGANHYANFITSLVIMGSGGNYTSVFSIEWGYMINGSQWQTTFPQQLMPRGLLYFGPGTYW